MNVWATVFLGIIALAMLATAIVQVGVLVAAGRLARRLTRLVDDAERQLVPIVAHLNTMAQDASRAASVASAQVDRVDRLFADVFARIEQGLDALQSSLAVPAREGRAVLSAVTAALEVLRDGRRGRRRTRADEEDALFI